MKKEKDSTIRVMRSLGGGRQQIGELDKRMGGKKRGRKREENKKKERERGTLGL